MSEDLLWAHIVLEHQGQLPSLFVPDVGVTWHMVHHLLTRLQAKRGEPEHTHWEVRE